VLDDFPKLSETFVLNEIVELVKRGTNVQILALRNPFESSMNEDVVNYSLVDRTKYFRLPPPLELKFGYGFSPDFYNYMLKTLKNYHDKITFKHMVRLSYYTPFYSNIDLIHSHFAYEAAVTGMQMSKILNKPFTFTAHAFELFSQRSYSKGRLKMLTDNAEKIITPSAFNKNYIIKETDCARDKIEVVRATINPEKFENQKRLYSEEDKIKIVAIGRMVEKKGFEYLIKAMSIIIKNKPGAFLNIMGTGDLENNLIKLTRELGLTKSVNFLGAQPNERAVYELSSSDIAVLPCVVAKDGDLDVCPLTLQEAMAMEIPVVSTTVGSIPELIEDGKEGLLVPERNETALAQAIIKLIDNPSLREEMGKRGREKITREFNIKTQVDKLLEIWERVIPAIDKNPAQDKFNPYKYWSERTKKFGKTAVGNLSKPFEEFEQSSESGKKKLLPLFTSYLTGNESKLLDFGCGYGRFTTDLAEFVSDEAWGIDATPELIKIAEKEKTSPKTFFRAAKGSLPFPNEYFDVIWISYVLEHIIGDEKEKIAEELLRVLKPGGLFFIIVNTVIGHPVEQCDIRPFKWYEKAFSPVKFEVRTDTDLKTINRQNIELLEEKYKDSRGDLVLIMIGRKHAEHIL
ncbi:MAG: glycosyltransferase, partial [Thermodesulfobacteriota bacterium]